MCRSHVQGYKRCKGSAASKTRESLRKSINYQAKKSGLDVWEWKVLNPDIVENIYKTYDERLHRFEKQFKDPCDGDTATPVAVPEEKPLGSVKGAIAQMKSDKEDPSLKKPKSTFTEKLAEIKAKEALEPTSEKPTKKDTKEPSGFSDAFFNDMKKKEDELYDSLSIVNEKYDDAEDHENDEEEYDEEDYSQQSLIHRYNFAGQGEKRVTNSHLDLEEYTKENIQYTASLNLAEKEAHSIFCYTNELSIPLNKYLLNKSLEDVYDDDSAQQWDQDSGYDRTFVDEKNLIDCVQTLDSALSHRVAEPRITYRGLRVRYDSTLVKSANYGKSVENSQQRRDIVEKTYAMGSEIVFDGYSSTSDSIDIAADWCGASSEYDANYDHSAQTGIIFEIKTSAGLPISQFSGHELEREVLLPRGLKFKVANSYWNNPEEGKSYSFNKTNDYAREYVAKNPHTMIVQLVEIDDQGQEIQDHTAKHVAPPVVVRSKEEGTVK